ncbi:Uncharacterized protein PECH_007304 [Penicillium ucsense]|uniref:MOSC domain-containing protein n=1 Tax=Penicillium ucsense TaxID=2839758 RepID=A0A8J8W025_9EURO|nr:Uncharacterized protein PECM_007859 [Penicillium ucsense]KAF7734941.1 Uncharacterized protein PECH_007304 [Penicillium ucsense]
MLDRSTLTSTPVILASGIILLLPLLLVPQFNGWTKHLRIQLPGRRRQRSEIVSLRVYPIKSCRGFEVQSTTLKEQGLDLDRRWMLVDASTHEFLTIRQIPQMTRIRTALSPDGNELVMTVPRSHEGSEHATDTEPDQAGAARTIRIPSHPTREWLEANTQTSNVEIWGTQTDGYIYRDDVNKPFSAFLGRPVALAYKGPQPRVLQGNGDPQLLGRTQSTAFPDVCPVLIASEASLAELNGRLQSQEFDPITIERFRPNIIVRGETPWIEDSWKTVRIHRGSASSAPNVPPPHEPLDVDVVARCARCQVPNVDPDTAVKHKKQPWDTLMSYRRVDEGIKFKPCFGMLAAPRNEGLVEVGMVLEVLEETDKHRYHAGF